MSWTKRQLVWQAFDEIGYASYNYDLEPEQLQSALRKLDSMMATWNGKGIKIAYPMPTSPENSDLDQESGVPDFANEAIYLNLAIRLAPSVGKSVSMETKVSAREAYRQVLKNIVINVEMQLPTTLPAGAGNKTWRYNDDPFIRKTKDNIVLPPKNEVIFNV